MGEQTHLSDAQIAADESAVDGFALGVADPAGSGTHGTDQAEPLGPADWGAWAGGILGIAAGLLVAGCLWLSTSGL